MLKFKQSTKFIYSDINIKNIYIYIYNCCAAFTNFPSYNLVSTLGCVGVKDDKFRKKINVIINFGSV